MLKVVRIYLFLFWFIQVNLKKGGNPSLWPPTFFEKNCNDVLSEGYVANISKAVESYIFSDKHCERWSDPCVTKCDISNTTALLYNKYTKAKENDFVNITELNLLSEQIDSFKYVDKMLFAKFLYLVVGTMDKKTEKRVNVFIDISRKLTGTVLPFRAEYKNFFSEFLLTLKTNITIVNRRFALKAWNPFQSNITGISLYNHTSNHSLSVKYIFRNQSSENIDVKDLQIAGYIPYELLSELLQGVSVEMKEKFRVVMLLVADDPDINRLLDQSRVLKYFVGIAIPGLCKTNELPMLTTFFKFPTESNAGNWTEFGKNYFDSLRFPSKYWILNRLSFFGPITTNVGEYFESPTKDYCLRFTTTSGNSSILWEQTPSFYRVYPKSFCVNSNLVVPELYCDHGYPIIPPYIKTEYFKCMKNFQISNNTLEIFHLFVSKFIGKGSYEGQAIKEDSFTFIDAKLYLQYMVDVYEYQKDETKVYDMFEKCLVLLQIEKNGYPQITYLSSLMSEMIYFNTLIHTHRLILRSNYIYEAFAFKHKPNGVTLYERGKDFISDHDITFLTIEHGDLSYNNSVEVVIKLNNSTKEELASEYFDFHYFIIYNNFTENDGFVCKSRTVGFYAEYYDTRFLEIDIYLKSIDLGDTWSTSYDNIENYSTTIKIPLRTLVIFYISVPKDDPCDSSSKLFIMRMPMYGLRTKSIEVDVRNRTVEKIDILSQLAMSLNPGSRKMHEKHSAILKIVTRICCILSSIGFFCIFISSLLLKGWYRRRMNTIQLSIAQTFQIVFILIGHSDISHIGYLLFYYSILSQFSWMSIIGYFQYLKFVKIFGESKLTTTKSIILGWLVPAVIVLTSMLFHMDCFKCNLCYKNDRIFTYFVIVPISLVIVGNFAVYIAVMASILRSKSAPKMKKTTLRAAVLLPFVLGISWTFIVALIAPWSWVTLTGSYLFHTVASLQGFILFVFTVVLNKDTRSRWWHFVCLILRRKDSVDIKQ